MEHIKAGTIHNYSLSVYKALFHDGMMAWYGQKPFQLMAQPFYLHFA